MDGFLYDDDTIDELCDQGKMSRNYCKQCGSHQVAPLSKSTLSSQHLNVFLLFYIMYVCVCVSILIITIMITTNFSEFFVTPTFDKHM